MTLQYRSESFKGYNSDTNEYTTILTRPKARTLTGSLFEYYIIETYGYSTFHQEALRAINYSIFTLVFPEVVPAKKSTWVRIQFDSPYATKPETTWLQKNYISNIISGPSNISHSFNDRIDSILTEMDKWLELGVISTEEDVRYDHQVKESLEDIKNKIVIPEKNEDSFSIELLNISLIPQPNIVGFMATIKESNGVNIKETDVMGYPPVKWPFCKFKKSSKLQLVLRIFGYKWETKQHSYYYSKRDKKEPKFQIDFIGTHEFPYLTLLVLLWFLISILFWINPR